jgi:hypothetical protein
VWTDLHVHTVLSPCAEVEMIPPLIIRRVRELGLELIAVTDHNSAENAEAVQRAAVGSGVTVLPGMEVQTREDIHLLCIFDTLDQVLDWQEVVYAHLPPLPNRAEFFGAQYVVDETGDYVRTNERLLLTATSLSVEDVVSGVRQRKGLPIAAHVDRMAYSLIATLGFVPDGLALAALEISAAISVREVLGRFPQVAGWPLDCSSDAHRLGDLRANMIATLQEPSVRELALALAGRDGRKVKLYA